MKRKFLTDLPDFVNLFGLIITSAMVVAILQARWKPSSFEDSQNFYLGIGGWRAAVDPWENPEGAAGPSLRFVGEQRD
ncbi:hypothetical protein [Mesorhizobium sp. 1B3]|uniref:hypothetical protein n=1 Tax=Mesorhizobium sp. 1B3 TaxID=3243599 RepID=UPI003D9714C9